MSSGTPKPFVRLLQITDTHLLDGERPAFGNFNTERSFMKVVARLRDELPADAILVTGDLADRAERGAYEKLGDELSVLDTPVFCIPGNHDDPDLMRSLYADDPVRYVNAKVFNEWAIVFLSTQAQGRVDGYLSSEELLRLEAHLTEFADKHVLICLHHHPVLIHSSWMDGMRLSNPDPLFEILDAHSNVRGMIWGHIHQAFDTLRKGVRLLGSPSTCIQFKQHADCYDPADLPPAYRWLHLLPDGQIETGIQWVDVARATGSR